MKTAALIGISRHRLTTDGEGVTTLVAFHGCPLHCKFCLNPQCLHSEENWERYNCQMLYEEVKQDELYFLATYGGITFGGGEPCIQSEFIHEFRGWCGPQWQITVETSLNVSQSHLQKLLPVVDRYIIDIKDMNSECYLRYTGKNNKQVINNLQWLVKQVHPEQMIIRVPLIPSYNTKADVAASISKLKEMGLTYFDHFIYRTPNNE